MALKGIHKPCSTIVLAESVKFVRPRLDPMMGETVLCARVAVQLVAIHYRYDFHAQRSPAEIARWVAAYLPLDYPGFLKFALHSLSVYLGLAMPSSRWLANVLEAHHFGHPFRRCFFFDYKENRRAYPRVTNRGVQTSPSAPVARVRKGRLNA